MEGLEYFAGVDWGSEKLVWEGRVERDAAGGCSIVEAGMNKPTPDDDVHGNQPSDAPRFPIPGSRDP